MRDKRRSRRMGNQHRLTLSKWGTSIMQKEVEGVNDLPATRQTMERNADVPGNRQEHQTSLKRKMTALRDAITEKDNG